jgi:spore maturation protein CgeB
MLSERSQDLLNLFEEDREAVYFSNPDELRRKVEYLLQSPSLIQSIAEAGYKKAMQHTIVERIIDIKNVYEMKD